MQSQSGRCKGIERNDTLPLGLLLWLRSQRTILIDGVAGSLCGVKPRILWSVALVATTQQRSKRGAAPRRALSSNRIKSNKTSTKGKVGNPNPKRKLAMLSRHKPESRH